MKIDPSLEITLLFPFFAFLYIFAPFRPITMEIEALTEIWGQAEWRKEQHRGNEKYGGKYSRKN